MLERVDDRDEDRIDVQVELFIRAQYPDGSKFLEAEYKAKTYRHREVGVYAINKTASDMIAAQVDLGRIAAERKGQTLG